MPPPPDLPRGASPRLRPAHAERGSALIWALFFVSVTTGLLLSHSWEMRANRKQVDIRHRQLEHARAFAKSGLTDATAWFRRQLVQPVTTFAPRRDLEAEPPIDDTLDPDLGLVREFEVRGGLWARYEVRTDECLDMSATASLSAGSLWDVGARGILFERLDANKPFDKYPNRVIATQTLRTEVRTVPMVLPAPTALVLPNPADLTVHGDDVVIGGGGAAAGIAFADNHTMALGGLPAAITGTPAALPIAALSTRPEDLFAMRTEKLELLSDVVVTADIWNKKDPVADQFVFVPHSLGVSRRRPLRGSGMLFVNGNFKTEGDSGSSFQGLIVVTGDVSIQGPFRLDGTLLVQGTLDLDSRDGPVVVQHDADAMANVENLMGRYHKSKETRRGGRAGAFTTLEEFADSNAARRER